MEKDPYQKKVPSLAELKPGSQSLILTKMAMSPPMFSKLIVGERDEKEAIVADSVKRVFLGGN